MKYFYLYFIFFCFLISCNSVNKKSISSKGGTNSTEISVEDQTYADMLKEYISSYNEETEIDTSINDEGVSLKLIYYCLFDDSLNVPGKYNWGTKEVFRTHNFAAKLIIKENNDTIVNKIIEKQIFNQFLPVELKKYGVLLYPELRKYNEESKIFQIHFSISIPLTDIGQSVILEVGTDGKIDVKSE